MHLSVRIYDINAMNHGCALVIVHLILLILSKKSKISNNSTAKSKVTAEGPCHEMNLDYTLVTLGLILLICSKNAENLT